MAGPWGEYGVGEWLRTQVRNTASSRRRVSVPVPPVELPGCAGGVVSSRHWLNWRQANAVVAFSVQLTREIVDALAVEGVTPIESWMRVVYDDVIVGGGRKSAFSAYGDRNGSCVDSRLRIPKGSIGSGVFERAVLPTVYRRHPIASVSGTAPSAWLPGPYGFRAGIVGGQRASEEFDTVRVVSPGYFRRYRPNGTFPGRDLSHWPLDPADEREPLIYPEKPRRLPPRRREIPAIAEYTMTEALRWGEYLGFRFGPVQSAQVDGEDVLTAPAGLTVDEAEAKRRTLPHTAVAWSGGAGFVPRELVSFRIFNGLSARIECDDDGACALTVFHY